MTTINRTTEKDLIIPATMILSFYSKKSENGEVSSEQLRKSLFRMMEPHLSPEDLEKLPSTSSRRIDQVMRNLVSNRTLDNLGYTVYNPETNSFKVTTKCLEKASDIALQVILKSEYDDLVAATEAKAA